MLSKHVNKQKSQIVPIGENCPQASAYANVDMSLSGFPSAGSTAGMAARAMRQRELASQLRGPQQ